MTTSPAAAAGPDANPAPRDPIVFALFAATLVAALATLGRTIIPGLDEGDYLAAARLMVAHGEIPYRDFAFAHPPWTTLAAGLALKALRWNVPAFDALYAAWCLCAVFPLARTVRALTASRAAALVAAFLFLTFPEFLRWDARFFALRQVSLPFFVFALEALWVRKKPALAGVLLGLFGAGLLPHAFLAVLFGGAAAFLLWRGGERRPAARLAVALAATLGLLYGSLFLVPGFWHELVGFHAARERVPALARLARMARETLPGSAPILLAGLAGSLLLPPRARALAAFTLVGLPVLVFAPPPYHAHYLSSFGPALAAGAGVLVARARQRGVGVYAAMALGAAGAFCSFFALQEPLSRTTPELLRVVRALEKTPEPLLSFEPIYALWARRDLTVYRAATSARYGPALGFSPFDDATFRDVLARSNTVLLEPSLARVLTPERLADVRRDFVPVWRDRWNVVLVRRTLAPPS